MAGKVIDVDRGMKEIMKTLSSLKGKGSYVKAGVMGKSAEEKRDKLTNVDIAIINEFGTKTIPARPFIGSTFDLNREKYARLVQKGLGKVYENKLTVERLLNLVGIQMVADIKGRVLSRDNNFTPNAPSTIARKMAKTPKGAKGPVESPRPLIDTGRMIGSVQHEVVVTGGPVHKTGKGSSVVRTMTKEGGSDE